MSKEKVKLEIPEKVEDAVTYNEAMKQLVAQKKAEFELLQGRITQYKTQLITLEEKLVRSQGDFDAKVKQEKIQTERERQKKLTELINREAVVQKSEAEVRERLGMIERREFLAEKGIEEKNKLINERLKFEQLNNGLIVATEELESLKVDARNKLDVAAQKENEAKKILSEVENAKSVIIGKEEIVKTQLVEVIKQKENLETLRADVTPKIEEYKDIVAKNVETLAKITAKEQEVTDKVEQDNKLLSILDEKERKLRNKEIELVTKEKELLRKEIMVNNQ